MKKTRIIFFILPHVHLLDLAGPDQVFQEAISQGAELAVEYCSVENTISASSGLSINRLKPYNVVPVSQGDYVIIPGAEIDYLVSGQIPGEKEVGRWLREGYNRGAFICSVCTGAFFVAKAGLLNGKKCTTHWKHTVRLKTKFPAVQVAEDILFTEDDRIMTSAGVTAGIDLALHITGKLCNDHLSFKVARELVIYSRRQGHEPQESVYLNYRNHIHSGVHKVQDLVQENIHKKLTLEKLAEVACMSARNLTRVFKKETGITINEYISLIRKANLKKLVHNPDITRKQMASLCGLKSERQVIRLINTLA